MRRHTKNLYWWWAASRFGQVECPGQWYCIILVYSSAPESQQPLSSCFDHVVGHDTVNERDLGNNMAGSEVTLYTWLTSRYEINAEDTRRINGFHSTSRHCLILYQLWNHSMILPGFQIYLPGAIGNRDILGTIEVFNQVGRFTSPENPHSWALFGTSYCSRSSSLQLVSLIPFQLEAKIQNDAMGRHGAE